MKAFDPPPASAKGRVVILKDKCGSKTRTYTLSKVFDRLKYIRVRELDGDSERPEVLFELRAANGRSGLTKLVRLGRPDQAGCAKPRTLFAYNSKIPPIAAPSGVKVVNWRITFGNYDETHAGNEMRLVGGLRPANELERNARRSSGSRTTATRVERQLLLVPLGS